MLNVFMMSVMAPKFLNGPTKKSIILYNITLDKSYYCVRKLEDFLRCQKHKKVNKNK